MCTVDKTGFVTGDGQQLARAGGGGQGGDTEAEREGAAEGLRGETQHPIRDRKMRIISDEMCLLHLNYRYGQ